MTGDTQETLRRITSDEEAKAERPAGRLPAGGMRRISQDHAKAVLKPCEAFFGSITDAVSFDPCKLTQILSCEESPVLCM